MFNRDNQLACQFHLLAEFQADCTPQGKRAADELRANLNLHPSVPPPTRTTVNPRLPLHRLSIVSFTTAWDTN